MLNKITRSHVIILDIILLFVYFILTAFHFLGYPLAGTIASQYVFPVLTFCWGYLFATLKRPSRIRE